MTAEHHTAMVVSPVLEYGSWSWFEDIIAHSPDVRWTVVAYGRPPRGRLPDVRWITWPMGNYLKIGSLASRRHLLWLNLVYVAPLAIVAFIVNPFSRVEVIVGNGVAVTSLLRPCRFPGRASIWLGYHSYVGWFSGSSRRLMRILLGPCDGAICNSPGSARDLAPILGDRMIIPVEHWADDAFFDGPLVGRQSPPGRLRVLYVGSTNSIKFGQCRRVLRELTRTGVAELTIAGPVDVDQRDDGITYVGYVSSREELAALYRWSDVVWAPADVDYLSRPGVEALACGRPVVVSDVPAVGGKCDGSVRIPRELVPNGVGWVVDGIDDDEALKLLEQLADASGPAAEPEHCRAVALERFSTANISTIKAAWFRRR